MRNLFQLTVIILFVNTSVAQLPCNDEVIIDVKGAWKKRADANMKADKNQAQIISRLDNFSKLYKAALQLIMSPAQYFKEQGEANFPIDKLKAMIDK